jgi:hypothetical protein
MEELQMDSLRSEDLKEEKSVTASVVIIAVNTLCRYQGSRVPLGMHRTNPEYFEPDLSYRSVPTDVFLREEPDDEEDEEKDDNNEEDDDGDEGYSE